MPIASARSDFLTSEFARDAAITAGDLTFGKTGETAACAPIAMANVPILLPAPPRFVATARRPCGEATGREAGSSPPNSQWRQ